jgi:hypothetical protein
MAMDAVRRFYDHLRVLGNLHGKIDLFIHSNGGDGTVPWRLVTLLREYCDHLAVLVPHRAFSAATLTALGADEIVMHPMGMLGPTDPTVTTPYNPTHPANPMIPLGINVEDVTAYIALIREDAEIRHEEEFVQAFNKMADRVHPLALGSVKRFLSQSRMMARKLLELHMDKKDDHAIDQIVDKLTTKLFFHGHPINRHEAKDQIGLTTVTDATPAMESLMWSLYGDYEQAMNLETPFDPVEEALANGPSPSQAMLPGMPPAASTPPPPFVTPRLSQRFVYVESVNRTDVRQMTYEIFGAPQPNGALQAVVLPRSQGWVTE